MSETPKRIQRKRTRGWKMPGNTVYVGRVGPGDRGHGMWGNPRRAGLLHGYTAADAVRDYRRWIDREPGVRSFEHVYGGPPTIDEIQYNLRGKNLCCWCPLVDKDGNRVPCHADVLLEIANR